MDWGWGQEVNPPDSQGGEEEPPATQDYGGNEGEEAEAAGGEQTPGKRRKTGDSRKMGGAGDSGEKQCNPRFIGTARLD